MSQDLENMLSRCQRVGLLPTNYEGKPCGDLLKLLEENIDIWELNEEELVRFHSIEIILTFKIIHQFIVNTFHFPRSTYNGKFV